MKASLFDAMRRFQFHKGAIKRLDGGGTDLQPVSQFQFHKGAIKSELLRLSDECDAGFNSIKVRLKASIFLDGFSVHDQFQFHKGAIKSSRPSQLMAFHIMFQFHKGAIKSNRL